MFPRKILPKIHFLCVLALVRSQSYEYNSDEGDTESDIEGDSHPDYSKYYSVTPKEGTIALASFAQPQQFGFGFGPFEAAFGASSQDKQKLIPTQAFAPIQAKPVVETPATFSDFFSKNLFGINQPAQPADYFEQSQTRQREEAREEPSENVSEEKENEEENEEAEEQSEYNQSGPSYISHDVPAKIPHQVETVKVQGSGLNLISPPAKVHDLRDYKDHHKYLPHLQPLVTPQVYPQAPGYQKFTQPSASPSLTPYQKFSFQPVAEYQNKYLENLNSASNVRPNYRNQYARVNIPSYVSQESKVVPRAADRKNCKRLTKESGNEKIGDLTCYVCENQETNSKVTECSYQSEPDSTDLHKGSSERYSVPAKRPDGFRYRRYASEEDSDPYEYVKNRSLRAQKEKQEEGDNYEYEGYDASQPEKSYSEVQSEEILKDPKKCTNVDRDGMSCRVCKDPATGGNYESCSFSTAPEPEKYAYVSEKNYNSNDDPDYASKGDESKNVATNTKANDDEEPVKDQKPKKERKSRKKYSKNSESSSPKGSKSEYSDYVHPKNLERQSWEEPESSKGEKSYYPKYEAESRQESRSAKNEEEEEDDTKSNSESSEDASPYKDIGEYKFKYFPEFSGEESRVKEEPLEYVSTNKKEVEDVLADFKKKDRSQCKQVKKNGMTCFLCVDENRAKNEECMFISESKPKGTYAKYTKNDEVGASSEAKPVTTKKSVSGRKKRSQKKMSEISGASSSKIESVVRAPSGEKQVPEETELKASASAQDAQRIEEKDESKLETRSEIDTNDEGGEYSAETQPVYSKALGMTLPKYMLDKSEFEKEFDALLPH
ncbi:nucleolin 2 [Harmonia axyridis]|uniref:nucleolin 2 n=1 Tax=Harmonia axyridis TaxID=115357 RepID=UPI001E27747E|nr:nucleolin 2 [Harmonia axyridis]